MLLERQLLSSNLLSFYFNRRQNYDVLQEQKHIPQSCVAGNPYGMSMTGKRRVEDSYKLYAVK